MEADVQLGQGVGQLPGHGLVLFRRQRLAAGVVVDQDQGGGAVEERQARDFPGVDRGLVDGALGDDGAVDEAVGGVQAERQDAFPGLGAKAEADIVGDVLGGGDPEAAVHLRLEHPDEQLPDQPQEGGGGFPETRRLPEPLGGLEQDSGQGGEAVQQVPCQRLGVPARDGVGEEQLQQFVVGHRLPSSREQPLPEAVAVAARSQTLSRHPTSPSVLVLVIVIVIVIVLVLVHVILIVLIVVCKTLDAPRLPLF